MASHWLFSLCQWCNVQKMEPDGEECQLWQLVQSVPCVHKVCSENSCFFYHSIEMKPLKNIYLSPNGVTALCFKSYEKHHMQGRPPTQPPWRPGCNRTHSWRAVEESTVSIHGSSLAPQLCHFQSIAFRKLASTLQFEMKSLFCCGAHSVYNDLALKKHACFSEAFSPVAANYIMCSCSKYSLNGFRESCIHIQSRN